MSEVMIDMECAECGKSLSASSPRIGLIFVEPCPKCLDAANNEGMRDAMKEREEA
jgi:hypothetical protein